MDNYANACVHVHCALGILRNKGRGGGGVLASAEKGLLMGERGWNFSSGVTCFSLAQFPSVSFTVAGAVFRSAGSKCMCPLSCLSPCPASPAHPPSAAQCTGHAICWVKVDRGLLLFFVRCPFACTYPLLAKMPAVVSTRIREDAKNCIRQGQTQQTLPNAIHRDGMQYPLSSSSSSSSSCFLADLLFRHTVCDAIAQKGNLNF